MRNGATAAPLLRMRDVAPAALAVVVLLGVAGCMGAFGGGPLDTVASASGPTAVAPPLATSPGAAPAPDNVAPSFVPADPDATLPPWFGDYADRLAESKRSGEAPAAFRDRKPLFSCGELVLDQGAEVPQSAWDCLHDGMADGAELTIVYPTTEGDPIIEYYRVGPDIDGVELFHDASRDAFGTGDWSHERCDDGPGAERHVLGGCR